jgi:hypothetical protein
MPASFGPRAGSSTRSGRAELPFCRSPPGLSARRTGRGLAGSRCVGRSRGPGPIKDGTDPAAFEAYLKQYPQGTFATLARQRLASVSQPAPARDLARFDGAWNVTVQCPAHGSASAYTRRLLAQVKDGALAAQLGDVGQPGFLTLSGKIQPDGKASIDARGMVGDARNAVNRLSQGAAYAYRVDAVFEGARGVGNRTDDAARPCSLTFVK